MISQYSLIRFLSVESKTPYFDEKVFNKVQQEKKHMPYVFKANKVVKDINQ
ncbi:hypothetical protein HMPREF1987_01655 [Peptostreptococcaceae bacterium oral taxon 113 str. W5053]|nr:hypothetical protein HMPREF1987_01655 [Peptostreptococcaceae bacterium oral taxon 113 str. W5053]